ncbi:hypothetical protein M422DRAFT_276553 [Sphaerobolus stellatus SS14]|uniref:Uncharacterized protein n=1 Tax=Sphaerobolus stellatus (strain SS14) TaxID=990650 RepID=A0A0C9U1S2_SPHS4|nr:hypothetical protein M422DRAFT_276553 [Sphaerobolus stellatus SS14]
MDATYSTSLSLCKLRIRQIGPTTQSSVSDVNKLIRDLIVVAFMSIRELTSAFIAGAVAAAFRLLRRPPLRLFIDRQPYVRVLPSCISTVFRLSRWTMRARTPASFAIASLSFDSLIMRDYITSALVPESLLSLLTPARFNSTESFESVNTPNNSPLARDAIPLPTLLKPIFASSTTEAPHNVNEVTGQL